MGRAAIIVKGDLTDDGTEDEFEWFAALVNEVGVPADVLLGNHDVRTPERRRRRRAARARRVRSPATDGAIDVPGLRIILLPSAKGAHDAASGTTRSRRRAIELAARGRRPGVRGHAPLPAAIQRREPVPGRRAATRGQAVPRRARPRRAGSVDRGCGHTHRHHRRHYKSLLITEIGSPKDFPGVWAGYVVYEGGITQIVHRVADPSCPCVDRPHRAGRSFGVWRLWSPGIAVAPLLDLGVA